MSLSRGLVQFYIDFYYYIIKNALKIIALVLGLIISFSLVILYTQRNYLFEYKILAVESNSMVPIFKKGDLLIIEKKSNYDTGDIINFYLSENRKKNFTHRIIGKEDGYYITQGDNNKNKDGQPVDPSLVQGKLVRSFDFLGNIVLFLRSVVGIITFSIIPITVFITIVFYDLWKSIKEYLNK